MAILQFIKIDPGGQEAILEETLVSDDWATNGCSFFYPDSYIEKLEAHHKKTGKPKKSHIDVLYITRLQTERKLDI